MAAALIALPGFALAADNAGPGCGLGRVVFKGQSGFFPHTSAATTNGTSWNQLFGLTSETSDCNPSSVVSREVQRQFFVASNLDHLHQEMAQGAGLHLQALADLMEIAPSDQPAFAKLTQERFPALLGAADEGPSAVLAALDSAMTADPVLARYTR
jgi:hypothetical protein